MALRSEQDAALILAALDNIGLLHRLEKLSLQLLTGTLRPKGEQEYQRLLRLFRALLELFARMHGFQANVFQPRTEFLTEVRQWVEGFRAPDVARAVDFAGKNKPGRAQEGRLPDPATGDADAVKAPDTELGEAKDDDEVDPRVPGPRAPPADPAARGADDGLDPGGPGDGPDDPPDAPGGEGPQDPLELLPFLIFVVGAYLITAGGAARHTLRLLAGWMGMNWQGRLNFGHFLAFFFNVDRGRAVPDPRAVEALAAAQNRVAGAFRRGDEQEEAIAVFRAAVAAEAGLPQAVRRVPVARLDRAAEQVLGEERLRQRGVVQRLADADPLGATGAAMETFARRRRQRAMGVLAQAMPVRIPRPGAPTFAQGGWFTEEQAWMMQERVAAAMLMFYQALAQRTDGVDGMGQVELDGVRQLVGARANGRLTVNDRDDLREQQEEEKEEELATTQGRLPALRFDAAARDVVPPEAEVPVSDGNVTEADIDGELAMTAERIREIGDQLRDLLRQLDANTAELDAARIRGGQPSAFVGALGDIDPLSRRRSRVSRLLSFRPTGRTPDQTAELDRLQLELALFPRDQPLESPLALGLQRVGELETRLGELEAEDPGRAEVVRQRLARTRGAVDDLLRVTDANEGIIAAPDERGAPVRENAALAQTRRQLMDEIRQLDREATDLDHAMNDLLDERDTLRDATALAVSRLTQEQRGRIPAAQREALEARRGNRRRPRARTGNLLERARGLARGRARGREVGPRIPVGRRARELLQGVDAELPPSAPRTTAEVADGGAPVPRAEGLDAVLGDQELIADGTDVRVVPANEAPPLELVDRAVVPIGVAMPGDPLPQAARVRRAVNAAQTVLRATAADEEVQRAGEVAARQLGTVFRPRSVVNLRQQAVRALGVGVLPDAEFVDPQVLPEPDEPRGGEVEVPVFNNRPDGRLQVRRMTQGDVEIPEINTHLSAGRFPERAPFEDLLQRMADAQRAGDVRTMLYYYATMEWWARHELGFSGAFFRANPNMNPEAAVQLAEAEHGWGRILGVARYNLLQAYRRMWQRRPGHALRLMAVAERALARDGQLRPPVVDAAAEEEMFGPPELGEQQRLQRFRQWAVARHVNDIPTLRLAGGPDIRMERARALANYAWPHVEMRRRDAAAHGYRFVADLMGRLLAQARRILVGQAQEQQAPEAPPDPADLQNEVPPIPGAPDDTGDLFGGDPFQLGLDNLARLQQRLQVPDADPNELAPATAFDPVERHLGLAQNEFARRQRAEEMRLWGRNWQGFNDDIVRGTNHLTAPSRVNTRAWNAFVRAQADAITPIALQYFRDVPETTVRRLIRSREFGSPEAFGIARRLTGGVGERGRATLHHALQLEAERLRATGQRVFPGGVPDPEGRDPRAQLDASLKALAAAAAAAATAKGSGFGGAVGGGFGHVARRRLENEQARERETPEYVAARASGFTGQEHAALRGFARQYRERVKPHLQHDSFPPQVSMFGGSFLQAMGGRFHPHAVRRTLKRIRHESKNEVDGLQRRMDRVSTTNPMVLGVLSRLSREIDRGMGLHEAHAVLDGLHGHAAEVKNHAPPPRRALGDVGLGASGGMLVATPSGRLRMPNGHDMIAPTTMHRKVPKGGFLEGRRLHSSVFVDPSHAKSTVWEDNDRELPAHLCGYRTKMGGSLAAFAGYEHDYLPQPHLRGAMNHGSLLHEMTQGGSFNPMSILTAPISAIGALEMGGTKNFGQNFMRLQTGVAGGSFFGDIGHAFSSAVDDIGDGIEDAGKFLGKQAVKAGKGIVDSAKSLVENTEQVAQNFARSAAQSAKHMGAFFDHPSWSGLGETMEGVSGFAQAAGMAGLAEAGNAVDFVQDTPVLNVANMAASFAVPELGMAETGITVANDVAQGKLAQAALTAGMAVGANKLGKVVKGSALGQKVGAKVAKALGKAAEA